ncbi:MAG: signal peptide peptidase SppA [Sedimentisphaerales bacterium]|nr:signal peptide peptidase SppA [Sedimentisphaerales bacterium]
MRFLKSQLLFIAGLLFIVLFPIKNITAALETSNTVSMDTIQTPVETKPSVVVHFHLSGTITESSVDDALGLTAGQITSLRSLTGLLEKAGKDDDVKAVIFTFDSLSMELGQIEELRNSINQFRRTSKKVYVHTEDIDNFIYTLLSTADYIAMAPQSMLWLTGLYSESVYIKDLLEKIGIEADFMQMGDFKSAAEMLTQEKPSDAANENRNWLLDSLYDSLVSMIAQSRGKTSDEVKSLIDDGPYLADEALQKGLIDAVQTRHEFIEKVVNSIEGKVVVNNRYGQKQKAPINIVSPLSIFTILGEILNPPQPVQKDSIALIYVEGTIESGYNTPSLLGLAGGVFSGDIQKAFETAAKDDSIKAVVMRVNSPGGSALASEVILNATELIKGKKPLVVSMGDVAGSGGYYIACSADKIYADEVTITASIGVVGGKLATTDLWDKIGVNWVDYKRGNNADLLAGFDKFNQSQREFMTKYMQETYDVFKNHVVKGREGKLTKPIDEIAGGRVYTGKQAKALGLIDEIGGLEQAIGYAASQVMLEDYEIRVIPEPKDFVTMILEEYSGQGERPSDITLQRISNLFDNDQTAQFLYEILKQLEPKRAKALYNALLRVELLQKENVILMMPFDMIYH